MESVPHEGFFLIDLNPGDDISPAAGYNSLSLQTVNKLDKEIIGKIATALGLAFINENEATGEVCFANEAGLRPEFRQSFTPVDLLDYINAILHSPGYSKNYQGFLKTGLAPVPYPTDADAFWHLVRSGTDIRQLP